jgi:predicted transcriptional regulator
LENKKEQKIKLQLESMKEKGFVQIEKGRVGTKITVKGVDYLVHLLSQYKGNYLSAFVLLHY